MPWAMRTTSRQCSGKWPIAVTLLSSSAGGGVDPRVCWPFSYAQTSASSYASTSRCGKRRLRLRVGWGRLEQLTLRLHRYVLPAPIDNTPASNAPSRVDKIVPTSWQ